MPTFQNIEVTFDVDFEVICADCGAGLCNKSDVRSSRSRGMPQVTVEPCEKCLAEAKDKGYDEGYKQAGNDADEAKELQ